LLFLVAAGAAHIAHLLARPRGRLLRTAWAWSVAVALAFAVGVAVIWATVLNAPVTSTALGKPVTYRSALDAIKRDMIQDALLDRAPLPVFVPTGLFIQSIEFVSANN